MTQVTHSTQKELVFDPNPFTLTFRAFTHALKINQTPVIVMMVTAAVLTIMQQLYNVLSNIIGTPQSNSDNLASNVAIIIIALIALIAIPIQIAVMSYFAGFNAFIGLMSARWRAVDLKSSLKSSLKPLLKIIGMNLFVGLVISGMILPGILVIITGVVLHIVHLGLIGVVADVLGAVLFIGGSIFATRYSLSRCLSVFAMYDESLGIFEALNRSKQLTKSRLIEAWGMLFAGQVVPIVSATFVACGLGAHYVQLKTFVDNKAQMPKTHILSWVPLWILLFVLFVVVAASSIILLAVLANR